LISRTPERSGSEAEVTFVSHPDLVALHPTGKGHPEARERLQALHAAFPGYLEAGPASVADIVACHDPDYVSRIRALAEAGKTVLEDPDTVVSATSYDAALLAAGCAIAAVRIGGFALVRPPGHHALPDRGMGFCLFGNVAVAARFAQRELEIGRVAILDWDVHHGNGTEAIFRGDASVFFCSLHQWPFYPGTGGPGEGDATTLNIPLPAGCGDEEYLVALERVVEPAIAAFDPELLLVSAGYDAAADDPLGGMLVSEAGFRELGARAARMCDRLALVLEGGYDTATLPGLVRATTEGIEEARLRR
jgi:acetoin utilization deacetylase AcuC-like enzyme